MSRVEKPPVETAEYPVPAAWFDRTAAFGPSERADAVAQAIAEASGREISLAGFLESRATGSATANSHGVFGWFPMTWLEYTNTARTPDGRGSGWSGVRLHDAGALDAGAEARIAAA